MGKALIDKTQSKWWEIYVIDPIEVSERTGKEWKFGDIFRIAPDFALGIEAHDFARGLAWRPIKNPTEEIEMVISEEITEKTFWEKMKYAFRWYN